MLFSALILGLLSSLHCIGMCGPIAMMLPLDRSNEAKRVIQLLLYHTGRLFSYGTLGLVFGIVGKGLYLAGLQQQLSIIAGIAIIAIVMIPERKFVQYNFSKPVYRIISKVKTGLGRRLRQKSNKAFFMVGLLNGFLPCGLVYAALFGAIAMQSVGYGSLYMMFYGIGTIPLMSLVVLAGGIFTPLQRNTLNKLVPYAMAFMGMLFIVRGLGLGIPFLSPSDMNLFVQQAPVCK
ncbi:sulfite exporter TauE/SafE family protein [Flavobacterium hauense]